MLITLTLISLLKINIYNLRVPKKVTATSMLTQIHNPSKQFKKKNSQQHKIPKETQIKIHDLQLYISSIFTNCSMPPLNQFLQLNDIQGTSSKLKLQGFKKELFGDEDRNQWIYYVGTGKVFLKKSSEEEKDGHHGRSAERIISASSLGSTKLVKKQSSNRDKMIEVKEGNFFMLANLRKIGQIEQYFVSGHENGQFNRSLIGKIKINPNYNLSWYLSESQKHQFLSTFLRNDEFSISEHKLKGLSRFFKLQNLRRGTLLSIEGQKNQKLYIIKTGQCQFSKNFSYNEKNHSNLKTLKVANAGPSAVLGSQFILYQYMGNSKSVSMATRAMGDLQKHNDKLNFKMYDKNVNNFTITVMSSFVELYQISVVKFKELCEKYVPEVPQVLRKNIEANYITLLRNTKEKLDLELVKIQRNQNKFNEQRLLVEAKMTSGHFEEQNDQENAQKFLKQSPIRLKKSQFIETNLQDPQVQKMRTRRLEKKIQLVLQARKNPTNFKKKIQIVLKQKLTSARIFESPILADNQKSQSPVQTKKIKKDLQSIFMNNDSNYRTNSITRQNHILQTKENLLKKRYSSVDNILIVHQDFYDKKKNKLFRMDLIQRGLKDIIEDDDHATNSKNGSKLGVEGMSNRIKKQCMEKINKANKIKQQFMTIRSECQNCHCYDDIESYVSTGTMHKSIKQQAMKTGSAWRTSVEPINNIYEEPLQKLHSRMKLMSEKASRKYHHNQHLHEKKRRFVSGSQRRLSAPLL